MVSTAPLKGLSAVEIEEQVVKNWVFSYGPPTDLITYNG